MSVRVMSMVWEADLPTTEKMVLLAIADSADDDGDNAWPSVATLARKASVSERRVQQIVKGLESRGLLTVHPQAGGHRGMRDDRRPNLYAISLDGVKWISPRPAHGVKSDVLRGEISDAHGVKPVSPNPSIETSNRTSKDMTDDGDFDEFWRVYPRKEAKKEAMKAWRRAIRTEAPSVIIAAALRYRADPNRDAEFTAHPTTWLNQGRWEDEPLPPKARKGSGTQSFLEASNALQGIGLLELEAVGDPF